MVWLEAYLSGGPRAAKEIQRVGLGRGFGQYTLKISKARLGFRSFQRNHEWFWEDPSVVEPALEPEPTLREVAEEIKRSVRQTVEAQTQVPPVAPQEPVIPPAPKEPKPRFGDILNREYVPPPPSVSICDAPNPDEMIAKATQGQLERMKNDLYERVNSEGTRTRPEEVDRLWALAERVRKQLGQQPRSEKYKPGYKPA
jgi:hypothetical protein